MKKQDFQVIADRGLQARPAIEFIKEAEKYDSEIQLIYTDKAVNAKSVMGVMSLGVPKNATITLTTSGEDENEALEGMTDALKREALIE